MSSREITPPEHAPANDKMDPPATPGPSHSAQDAPLTPAPAASSRRQRTLLPSTPKPAQSSLPQRSPRTPGNAVLNSCTVDESLYARVIVHTAKCTECDKRNMNTMRRCPGCTFQVCQPCYQKREHAGRGLVHGIMPTQGMTSGALATGNGGRTARNKPVPSKRLARSSEKQAIESSQEQEEGSDIEIDSEPFDSKLSTTKKRSLKKPRTEDSELEKSSSDEFDPEDASPSRNKFRRADISFAESARATAVRTPLPTRAARRLNAAPLYEAPSPSAVATSSSETFGPPLPAHNTPTRHLRNDMLYQKAIQDYDEPLLGRREPILSNPVAHVPAIVQRGGHPRPSAEQISKNIQHRLPEKMAKFQEIGMRQGDTMPSVATHNVKGEDNDAYAFTVRAFVEQEAGRYLHNAVLDEDENKALFHAMEGAALLWGKQTYAKLDPTMQQVLRPGLNLRLDKIDGGYAAELKDLLAEHAARMFKELSGDDHIRLMSLSTSSEQ